MTQRVTVLYAPPTKINIPVNISTQSEIVHFVLLLVHISLDTSPSILGYSIYYTTLTLENIAMNLYLQASKKITCLTLK
jgi:hypothetical protein